MEKINNSVDLELKSYHFELPEDQVAYFPCEKRDGSKLLSYNASDKSIGHHHFFDLINLLHKGDTLVLNQSKVEARRFLGKKISGGNCEILVLNVFEDEYVGQCFVKCRGLKNKGDQFIFDGNIKATIEQVLPSATFVVRFDQKIKEICQKIGIYALPPYIRRKFDREIDSIRYQTVFAKTPGSVAAPTAGLHFTPEILKALKEKGINIIFVELHVGAGTFAPVKEEKITNHFMHKESYFIAEEDCLQLNLAKKEKRRIIAVGTTAFRALQSCYDENLKIYSLDKKQGETEIFIYPGKNTDAADGLLTNFHLPKSSLLMLVSAFIGRDEMMRIYKEAISREYRFFTYGDASLLLKEKER